MEQKSDKNGLKPSQSEQNDVEVKGNLNNYPLLTADGLPYEITEEGSLGLLAMGYAGIMLWRDKRYRHTIKADNQI